MARPTDRQLIEALIQHHEPLIREAFMAAVDSIRNTVTLRVVVERLERGDINGAIRAFQIEPEAFGRLDRAILDAYNDGGQATVDNLPMVRDPEGSRVVFRFGVRNLAAEEVLSSHSSTLITRIAQEQREAVRRHLTDGLSQGLNPRQTALDVIGRVQRGSNRRQGGIIGLSGPQEQYVANARRELLSGDPAQMRNYFTRGRRDKRFDRTVAKAIRDEAALDQDTVSKIIGRYSDRLLELRGETIARSETMTALNMAKVDAIQQQIDAGKIDVRDVVKIWHATPDDRTRDTHRALNKKSVPLNGAFISPSGASIRYPGDPMAPASEHVNCRCWLEIKVDFLASVVRTNRAA